MDREEMKRLLNEKKSEPLDSYGLTKKRLNSDEENQITPYDAFLLEDSLRIINYGDLYKLKEKISSKLDKDTGLYKVTIDDVSTEYYFLATLLNRMTDQVYAAKVGRCTDLLKRIISGIKYDYDKAISRAVSDANYPLDYSRLAK